MRLNSVDTHAEWCRATYTLSLSPQMGHDPASIISLDHHVQCLQKVFIPFDLFYILLLQPDFKMDYIVSPVYTQYPIMPKGIHVFTNVCKFMKNEIQKYLIYISIHTPESTLCRSTFGSDYSCKSFWVSLKASACFSSSGA